MIKVDFKLLIFVIGRSFHLRNYSLVLKVCLALPVCTATYTFVFPYAGIISANGDAGTSSGGASGGSLWIETNGFHGAGTLQANGGAGRYTNHSREHFGE